MVKSNEAKYFETYGGWDYYRDQFGNVYVDQNGTTLYCSNLKRGKLTENKAEPSYPVDGMKLIGK